MDRWVHGKSPKLSNIQLVSRFNEHFARGKILLEKAVELDEKAKAGRVSNLDSCEYYHRASIEFKQALFSYSQITDETQVTLLGKNKKQLDIYLQSADERYEENSFAKKDDITKSQVTPKIQPIQRKLTSNVNRVQSNPRLTSNGLCRSKSEIDSNLITREILLRGVDPNLGSKLLDEIIEGSELKLSEVSGCEEAKTALEEAILLPSVNPDLFTGLRQPVKGILLFGPPGNGKTMLAKAIAGETNQLFFNISASSLTSKWVGDGEKTVKALFQIARNAQPCIVIVFIGATNRPQELDDAVLRRFPKRIFLSLPDEVGRFNLIKSILKKYNLCSGLYEKDLRYIASLADGYSYSDLTAVCKEAAMFPVRDLDRRKLATMKENNMRHLKISDFEKALAVVKPSTNKKQLDALADFANKSGQKP